MMDEQKEPLGGIENAKTAAETVETSNQQKETLSFRATMAQMPYALIRLAISRFAASATLAIAITIMWVLTKDWHYSIGYIISLFAAYVGMDIIWKYGDNRIQQQRMVICKVTRGLKNQVHLILRDASTTDLLNEEVAPKTYTIQMSKKDQTMVCPGTVMNIFISETSPNTILAYEILGEIGA